MHDSGTLWLIEHDQLQQVPRPIRADKQVADRVLGDFFDHCGVADGMVDVGILDPVPSSRRQHIHTEESYYETSGLVSRRSDA